MYFPWPPLYSGLSFSKWFTLTVHTLSVTNIAILCLMNEYHAEISYRIPKTLIYGNSVTYYTQKSVGYKDNSGKQLYTIEFLNSSSPSALP